MLSSFKNLGLTALILLLCLSIGFAQGNDERGYNIEGKLISQGGSKSPTGELAVTNYRLEEIKLDKPFDLRDQKKPIEKAFRLVINTKKPLPLNGALVWIDEFNSPARYIRPNAAAIIIYERTLPNGATISLSLPGNTDSNSRSTFSETISVPFEYATPWEEIQARTPVIKLRKINNSIFKVQIRIERAMESCAGSVGRNLPLMLEIDGDDYNVGCDEETVVTHRFTAEDFDYLKDGSEIYFKFGWGANASRRRVIGRLNKNIFE